MTALPVISVLMTTLNSERFISEAIESVLRQTLPDFELLIIDGGSGDNTLEIVRSFADPRIRVHRYPGLHRGARLNHGISLAVSGIIAIMDSDDIAMPTRLERQFGILSDGSGVSMVGSWAYLVDETGKSVGMLRRPLRHRSIARQLFSMNGISMGTSSWKKDLFLSGARFSETLRLEDIDWYVRIEPIATFANIREPLMMLRQRSNSRSRLSVQNDRTSLFDSMYAQFQDQLSAAQTRKRRSDIHRNIGICSYYYGNKKTAVRHLLRSFAADPFSLLTLRYLLVEAFVPSPVLRRLRASGAFRNIASSVRNVAVMISIFKSRAKK